MYRYLDRPLTNLSDGERVLVWAMRRWLDARRAGECPAQSIGAVFSTRQVLAGLAPFQQVMTLLDRQGRQTLVFAPLRCRRVSEGEAVLLTLVGGVLATGPTRTHATATLLVSPDHVNGVVDALARLACAFAEAGLVPLRLA